MKKIELRHKIKMLSLLTLFGIATPDRLNAQTEVNSRGKGDRTHTSAGNISGKNTLVYIGAGSTVKTAGDINPGVILNSGLFKALLVKDRFSLGINISGQYGFTGKDALAALPPIYHISGETSSSVAVKYAGRPKLILIKAGPQLNFFSGNHFMISPILSAGFMSLTQRSFEASQTTQYNNSTLTYSLLKKNETKTSGFAFTPALRLQYLFNSRIGIWAEGNYTKGPSIKRITTDFVPQGSPDQEGKYALSQMENGSLQSREKSIKNNRGAATGGVIISFGKNIKNIKEQISVDNATLPRNPEEKTDKNGFVFSWRKEPAKNDQIVPGCITIQNPKNGSSNNIAEPLKINLRIADKSNPGQNADGLRIIIYKISRDKNYWNKKENMQELLNTNNLMLRSLSYEKEARETGFKPLVVTGKRSGDIIETLADKGTLTEGAYKLVVNPGTDCNPVSSNFSITSTDITITDFKINCGALFGSYNFIIKAADFASASIIAQNLALNTIGGGTISGITITGLPVTVNPSVSSAPVNITITGSFNYSGPYPGTISAILDGYAPGHAGDINYKSTDAEIETFKPCLCDFCEKAVEFDNNQAPAPTYSAAGNSLTINQDFWNMNTSVTAAGAKAEIVSFERYVSDECMKCDKNSNEWGNFISGKSGTTTGVFNASNTRHSLYFYPSDSYSFRLNISVPPLSSLSSCCERIVIKIRYTYIFKDAAGECKMCSTVFEYEFKKGTCIPVLPWNPGGNFDPRVRVAFDVNNDIKKN